MRPKVESRARLAVLVLACAIAVGGVFVADRPDPSAASTVQETYPAPASGSWTVAGHGNGHGHGLSQYGAQGAALRGLTAAQIIAFYYSNTALVAKPAATIRVQLGDMGSYTTVAARAGLTVSGVSGALPTAGISRYRLVPSGAGLALQRLTGSTWATVKAGLPSRADFSDGTSVRLFHGDGSYTEYRGTVGAVRSGAGEITVNRLGLDAYVQGVVPREMPASWSPAALQAQAIAVRSYARYALEHNAASAYDICDSSNCQVYGGMQRYSAAGVAQYGEDARANAATVATANRVATYQGATIFAQFSAADGGWTTAGGQPYLLAKADPYEQYAGGPYLNWVRSATPAAVAGYYGLARVTAIRITGRDGNGQWGGRVTTAIVDGTTAAGAARSVSTNGDSLAAALGVPHAWFQIQVSVPSAPTAVSAAAGDGGVTVRWGVPTSSGSSPITGYTISAAGGPSVTVAASARSAWLATLVNGTAATVTVRAVSAAGAGATAAVSARPVPAPARVLVPAPTRMFDTRPSGTVVSPTQPLRFGVPGHAGVPATATAIQIALTIVNPTASGRLTVAPDGSTPQAGTSINYTKGVTTSVTTTVVLKTSAYAVFRPSAGSVGLVADLLSYSSTAASSASMAALPATSVLANTQLATGAGTVVPIRGVAGVPASASGVALQISAHMPSGAGWVKAYPDGGANPTVSGLTVPAGVTATNTLIVPIGTDGAVRVAAMAAGTWADVNVVGYTATSGAGLGQLESVVATPLADAAAGSANVSAGTAASALGVLSHSGIPVVGVQGILVHVTLSGASVATDVRIYPWGLDLPTRPTTSIAPGHTVSATILVRPGRGGAFGVVAGAGKVSVAVDVLGYITS